MVNLQKLDDVFHPRETTKYQKMMKAKNPRDTNQRTIEETMMEKDVEENETEDDNEKEEKLDQVMTNDEEDDDSTKTIQDPSHTWADVDDKEDEEEIFLLNVNNEQDLFYSWENGRKEQVYFLTSKDKLEQAEQW